MRYTDDQIRVTILEFVEETNQFEIQHVIAFCLGFYGYITKQIWNVIFGLHQKGLVTFAEERE